MQYPTPVPVPVPLISDTPSPSDVEVDEASGQRKLVKLQHSRTAPGGTVRAAPSTDVTAQTWRNLEVSEVSHTRQRFRTTTQSAHHHGHGMPLYMRDNTPSPTNAYQLCVACTREPRAFEDENLGNTIVDYQANRNSSSSSNGASSRHHPEWPPTCGNTGNMSSPSHDRMPSQSAMPGQLHSTHRQKIKNKTKLRKPYLEFVARPRTITIQLSTTTHMHLSQSSCEHVSVFVLSSFLLLYSLLHITNTSNQPPVQPHEACNAIP